MATWSDERQLPILPLREVVVFPGTPAPLIVARARSVSAIAEAQRNGGEILLVTQRRGDVTSPGAEDLFEVGTVARIEQALKLPDGNTKLLIEGLRRAQIVRHVDHPDHFRAVVRELVSDASDDPEVEALTRTVKGTVERYVKLNRAAPPDMLMGVNGIEDPSRLADLLVGVVKLTLDERQSLLETFDVRERLERVFKALQNEIEFLQVERKLRSRVRRERDNTEREAWIDEQMRAIQKELGDRGEGRDDLDDLTRQLAEKELTDEARTRAERELRRLSQMNPMSAEATVVRNYLDWLLALPWVERAEVRTDLPEAAAVLDEAHYGLVDVKERILEYLAVASLADDVQGPILCLVGPPGVGKTSFARSIAKATGRPFARIALGGVRDEAEIRGHRRTYIGALPGRIVQAMKRAGARNPLLLLDEVDKMSSDIRGDPASALLEVLDPEQNQAFNDHYLDLDYDLSDVMFLCTANSLHGVPLPLLDRLEVIELSGYTEMEKLAIAERYLVPKQRRASGLTEGQVSFSRQSLLEMARRYTKESGVRALEREIGKACRKVARRVLHFGPLTKVDVVTGNLEQLLGPPRHDFGRKEEDDQVGLVKGLSVSSTGGELLAIEVAAVPGTGKLITTGRLGEVLKESATAVFTYVRSRAAALHLDADFHDTQDFHIHYPGLPGGVEGPSAGIAMATALVSCLTGIPVRSDTAMTGEITLRGRVLPIGGVKEKLLAAHRGGITRVLVPERNRKDLVDVPEQVRDAMEILFVDHMDRVLQEALTSPPLGKVGAAWSEPSTTPAEPAATEPATPVQEGSSQEARPRP
ncbi:MAG: endopeptidase La [Alphaproteobacteria bacterium]|nr:endopeptidase La [Alphaproteobacteria bacterium]